MIKFILKIFVLLFFFNVVTFAEIVKNIKISGNERISNETIILFSDIPENKIIDELTLNRILKDLYKTGFFKDVEVVLKDNILSIFVDENPIIQTVFIEGVKAKKIKNPIKENLLLKDRSSFNLNSVTKDEEFILSYLKSIGYYFSNIKTTVETLNNNKVNLKYLIELGDKSKIKRISFIGNKIYKDNKLRNIIISEEYKPWKFISSKKYLNEDQIDFDKRLLLNFYKNKGYYNAVIESSFAKYIQDNNFELIYNINSGKKFFFKDIKLTLPEDFDKKNFNSLENLFLKINEKPYSINTITKILKEIDKITLKKQYEFITSTVKEKIIDNTISLNFFIEETDKYYVERINILGNDITREEVIRDNFIIDEGDAFNELLHARSINNLKSLNFFESVETEVIDGSDDALKIINISLKEKPTGEITAGAGIGTNGATLGFKVSENNFLGKGIKFTNSLELSTESIKGLLSVENPNYKGSDKSIYATLESSETDRLTNFGYKSTKTGFSIGSGSEYYEDLFLKTGISSYYESLKTTTTASANMKKQKGSYFDTYFNYTLDLDKRNQKFKTSEGYRSSFTQKVPIVSKNNTLINYYDFKIYRDWLNQNLFTFGFYASASNSLTGKNVKLSERLFIPNNKLRGFENGKVGPRDGKDYVGGNYVMSLNLSTSLPQVLPNSQTTDFSLFYDAANVWGVDYSSSLNDSSKIRSSIGISVNWFTPIGPLNFTLSEALTQDTNDVTETFRFNLGTTF